MRQVFSSARIENAEAVARLLEAEGIEVRVEHGRSFKRAIRGNFSYRADADNGPKPTVWVIRSDEQPRARQLLREAGLLDGNTTLPPSFLPPPPRPENVERDARSARNKAMRLRLGLLAVILIIAAAIVFKPMPDPQADSPVRVATQQSPVDPSLDVFDTVVEAVHLLPTPPALAATLALREQAGHGGDLCLGIDGGDPPEATLEALRSRGVDAQPASSCAADEALRVDVDAWRTDGSGSGTVSWSVGAGSGEALTRSATARRNGDTWHLDASD